MAQPALKLPASYAVAVSSSERLVGAAGRNVVVADFLTRRRLFSVHPLAHPSRLAFSPGEAQLAVKNTVGEVCILQAHDGTVESLFRPPEREEGPDILYSACGNFVVHATWAGILRVHHIAGLPVAQELEFPEDHLFSVSASADRTGWLVGHLRGSKDLPLTDRLTLLSLWRWPLNRPATVLEMPSQYLKNAVMSPCGRYIAILRQGFAPLRYDLEVISLTGEVLGRARIELGGTGDTLRWSPDSSRLCAVVAKGFAVFQAPRLVPEAFIRREYPSDMAFIDQCRSVVLGTWNDGVIAPLRDA